MAKKRGKKVKEELISEASASLVSGFTREPGREDEVAELGKAAELRETMIETVADSMCLELLKERDKSLNLGEIARRLATGSMQVEKIARILQDRGVVRLIYPVNVLSSASVKLERELERKLPSTVVGSIIDKYELTGPHIRLPIAIVDEKHESRPVYHVFAPIIGPYTMAVLDALKEELARQVSVESDEISDPRLSPKLADKFYNASVELVNSTFPMLNDASKKALCDTLLFAMYGLGDMELMMLDDWLEEIAVNGSQNPISVYHRKFGWLKTNMFVPTEEDIYNYASQIGRKAGREINLLSPIMDAHLTSGDRVSATLFPISTLGDTITIRRFARNPWTIIDFIDPKLNTLSSDMAAFLWLCIQYEMNMLVVGGTASGKTSVLNTLCHLLPANQRTITIEDTRELSLPSYLKWNWIPLTTRNPNPEGKGGVGMIDLMESSLRMRPDRVIVGEVRRRREAEVLFEAMHTGHAVYSTVHADNAAQLIRRLTNRPIELPPNELQALHLIVVQYRDRRKGLRRTSEITELTSSAAGQATLNSIYRWRPRTDAFDKINESLRVLEELNMHTGMTMEEIKNDIADKKSILEWMLKNNIRTVDKVGSTVGFYYKSPAEIIRAAEKNLSPESVL